MRIDNHMAGYRPALAKAKKNTKFVAGSFVPTLSKGSPLDWTTPEERNSNADDGKYEHPRKFLTTNPIIHYPPGRCLCERAVWSCLMTGLFPAELTLFIINFENENFHTLN